MPLVRISHTRGPSPEFGRRLSDAVHRAMVETYGVPPEDRFQVVTEHLPGDGLVITDRFLGIDHTPQAVLIQITCAEGRTLAQKKSLYAAIAANVQADTGARAEDVIVNLVETPRENWSFGNGLAPFAPQ